MGYRAHATPSERDFSAWLDDEFVGHIVVSSEHEQWYALLLEFDITGCGQTRAEAVRNSFELLGSYLYAHFEDGVSFAQAIRPVPWRVRARITAESAIGSMLRNLAPQLSRERTYTLPPGLLRYAH